MRARAGRGDRLLCCWPSICLASTASTCMDESQAARLGPTGPDTAHGAHSVHTAHGAGEAASLQTPAKCAVRAARHGPVSVSAEEVGSRNAATRACVAGSLPSPPRALAGPLAAEGSGGETAKNGVNSLRLLAILRRRAAPRHRCCC